MWSLSQTTAKSTQLTAKLTWTTAQDLAERIGSTDRAKYVANR